MLISKLSLIQTLMTPPAAVSKTMRRRYVVLGCINVEPSVWVMEQLFPPSFTRMAEPIVICTSRRSAPLDVSNRATVVIEDGSLLHRMRARKPVCAAAMPVLRRRLPTPKADWKL